MSETVHYRGKAEVVLRYNNKSYEDIALEILKDRGKTEMPGYYANAIEWLCDLYDEEFFYYEKQNRLFKLQTESISEEEEIIEAKMNEDKKQINFELRFYNGGAGFSECLEEAFDKVDFQ